MNFVPAVAYHLCLNLPATFTQPGALLQISVVKIILQISVVKIIPQGVANCMLVGTFNQINMLIVWVTSGHIAAKDQLG